MSFYNVFQGAYTSLETVDFLGYRKLFNHIAVLFSDQLDFGDNNRFDDGVCLIVVAHR